MKSQKTAKFSMLRRAQSVMLPVVALAMLVLGVQACGFGHGDDQPIPDACVPGTMLECTCNATDTGVAECLPAGIVGTCFCEPECIDGTTQLCNCASGELGIQTCFNGEFDTCFCETPGCKPNAPCHDPPSCHDQLGTPFTCGDGIVQMGEECDDVDCDPTDECNDNCKLPFCGDGVVQPPEVCDGDETCPSDCGIVPPPPVNLVPVTITSNGGPGVGQGSGIDVVNSICKSQGADGICTYEHWKQFEEQPGEHAQDNDILKQIIGVGGCMSMWLHRTMALPGCPRGPAGRCNDWTYPSGDLVDGEFVDICNVDGTLQFSYKLDCDPVFDSTNPNAHVTPGMQCSTVRRFACCVAGT